MIPGQSYIRVSEGIHDPLCITVLCVDGGEGSDPVLRPRTTAFQDWTELPALIAATGDQGSKVSVAFLFAPPDTPVARLAPVVRTLSPRIDTFYVFAGEAEEVR